LPDLPPRPLPSYLPPRRVQDSKILRLNVIVDVDHSQPGGSWTPHGSPPVRWRSQCGGDEWRHGDSLPPGLAEPGARRTSAGRTYLRFCTQTSIYRVYTNSFINRCLFPFV